MYKIIIIEDEPAIRRELSFLIGQESDMTIVDRAENVKDGVALIEKHNPDIILMDIQLRDGTAFDLIRRLNEIPGNIIFITAYSQFAIKAVKYGALDYLLKPIDHDELKEALERYRRKKENDPQWMQRIDLAQQSLNHNTQLPESIALHTINNVSIITVQDIMYCKGDGPYTTFFLANGSEKIISKPLKYYEDLLHTPYFLRTHQSYLVNRQYISCLDDMENVLLRNNDLIPVSARRKKMILKEIQRQI